jgi:hypothetical protein
LDRAEEIAALLHLRIFTNSCIREGFRPSRHPSTHSQPAASSSATVSM